LWVSKYPLCRALLPTVRSRPHFIAVQRGKIGNRDSKQSVGNTLTANTETPAKNQDWQKRYFDSLDALERERQKFLAMDAVLKRLAGRLGSASLGQSKQLDEQIKVLQAAIRRDGDREEFEKIASALTDAIAKLGSPAPPSPTVSAQIAPTPAPTVPPPVALAPVAVVLAAPRNELAGVVDAPVRGILSALLAQLRHDPALIVRADALDSRLAIAVPQDQLAELMSSISELVTQRIQHIERSKKEIEGLLRLMLGKLDDLSRFVSDHSHDQSQSVVSRESFNAQLVGEMKAMGESVESAADLQQMRAQVRGRLDSIGRHLKQFRERETARLNEMRTRNEQMQSRVTQLEAEASKLHHQLNDEQRLSTIDGLTNIPNRLAYEKRIQEELNRWQRFKQPTCLAVWDIDHFKDINDKYGHRAGDLVLHAVATSLASRVRSTDFLARFGGEEFVMILCGTKMDAALRVIEQMRIAISELKFHTHGTPLPPVTISIGVTTLEPNDSAGGAFDRADKALYQAKNTGRNQCVSG
jgi:diguanylate cyclase